MQDDNQRWQSGASDDGTESLALQPRFRASICTGENTCEASDAARVARQDIVKAAERAKPREGSLHGWLEGGPIVLFFILILFNAGQLGCVFFAEDKEVAGQDDG